MEVSDSRVVVERSVLGRSETRAFSLTSATKVEGRLSKDARVTVQFTNGDTAVYIIVRPEQKS